MSGGTGLEKRPSGRDRAIAPRPFEPETRGFWPAASQELLLRAALDAPAAASEAWRTWRAEHGPKTFGDVDYTTSRLFPAVFRNVERQDLDDPWLPRIRGVCRHLWILGRLRRRELLPVVTALRDAGARPLLLKGEALVVAGHARDDGSRTMADSDVMVPEECLDAADEAMAALGWTPLSSRGGPAAKRHAFAWIKGEREVDVHRRLLPLPHRIVRHDLMDAFASEHDVEGVPVRVPHATELLFHALITARRHRAADPPPFLWVMDVVRLLAQEREPIDWARLLEHALRFEHVLAVREGLGYAAARFGAPVPADWLERARAQPVTPREVRLLVRYAGRRPLLSPSRAWAYCRDDYEGICEALGREPTRAGFLRHVGSRAVRRGGAHLVRYVRRLLKERGAAFRAEIEPGPHL